MPRQDEVEAELGPVMVWVNAAMVTVMGQFRDVEPEDFDRVHQVVFNGTANGTRTALRLMHPRGQGRVIQVGSALAYRGIPLQGAYCSAKHAVQGLCDSIRAELRHQGSAITLSEVNLPAINTPQFDAAAAIAEAARTGDRSLHVTFTTTRTVVGDKVAPGALDRVLAETGYSGQRNSRSRPEGHNLCQPLPGDHGCHGSFDRQARDTSTQERLRSGPLGRAALAGGRLGRRVGAAVIRRLV